MRPLWLLLIALSLLPAVAAQVPMGPPVVVAAGDTLELQTPCNQDAVLESSVSIIVQGTVVAVHKGCSGPGADQAAAGTSLIIWAPYVQLDGGTLIAEDGDPGSFRDTAAGYAYGQSGGDGGSIHIEATRYRLAGTAILGSGGDAGDLQAIYGVPLPHWGGKGGDGGVFTANGTDDGSDLVFQGGDGGDGGDIDVRVTTIGLAGTPGVDIVARGGHGGNASTQAPAAVGGDGGDATVTASDGKPGSSENETTDPDGGHGGNATAYGGDGGVPDGRGGQATAIAGRGGDGADLIVPPCITTQLRAGHGGHGGDAVAQAGIDGGSDGTAASATATAGDGGDGGDDTRNDGQGGFGGQAGYATASGRGIELEIIAHGGHGGDARTSPGIGGDSPQDEAEPRAPGGVRFAGAVDCKDGGPQDPYAAPTLEPAGDKDSPAPVWYLALLVAAMLRRR